LQTPFALGVRRDSERTPGPVGCLFKSARLSRRALKLPITHGFSQFEIWFLLFPYQGARSEPALSEVEGPRRIAAYLETAPAAGFAKDLRLEISIVQK